MILDTTPEAMRLRWRVLADLSGEERLSQALELTDFVLRLSIAGRLDREQRQEAMDRTASSGPS